METKVVSLFITYIAGADYDLARGGGSKSL